MVADATWLPSSGEAELQVADCSGCDVLMFVPLNTTANIILSVASGMICLSDARRITYVLCRHGPVPKDSVHQEYKSVKSWPGLCTAGLSMLCGIFMLVTGPAETMEA